MNPLTDKQSTLIIGGQPINIIQPGGKIARSNNWRLTEKAFRAYEQHIRAAITAWPNETKFDIPAGMSVNTFEHRLRDAMQALKLYGYDVELQQQLAALRTELVVSMDPDGSAVWIRERGKRGRPVTLISRRNERVQAAPPTPVFESFSEDTLREFLILARDGARKDPVHFRGRIDISLQDKLISEFDTAFVYDDTQDITIML